MKLFEILNDTEPDDELQEISVLISADALARCGLTITTESIWMPSGEKDWMYRVDPADPKIHGQRHIHIARAKHASAKNMQASWNEDGSRHDKKTFNQSVGDAKSVQGIARRVLKLPQNVTLESLETATGKGLLMSEVSVSSDRKVAIVRIGLS